MNDNCSINEQARSQTEADYLYKYVHISDSCDLCSDTSLKVNEFVEHILQVDGNNSVNSSWFPQSSDFLFH